MRIRTVKPEFWRSMDIRALDMMGRLLFIGLLNYVDDNGVGDDSPALIASEIFPDEMANDPVQTIEEVDTRLWKMSEIGLVVRFTDKNKNFLEISKFSTHQRIQTRTKGRNYPNYQPRQHLQRISEKNIEKNKNFSENHTQEREQGEEYIKERLVISESSADNFSQPVDKPVIESAENENRGIRETWIPTAKDKAKAIALGANWHTLADKIKSQDEKRPVAEQAKSHDELNALFQGEVAKYRVQAQIPTPDERAAIISELKEKFAEKGVVTNA